MQQQPEAPSVKGPTRRMSGYAYFLKTCYEKYKVWYPSDKVDYDGFGHMCYSRWMSMPQVKKNPFIAMSTQQKKRHDEQLAMLPIQLQHRESSVGWRRKRREEKDPQPPKRAMGAFLWFCKDFRAEVTASIPPGKYTNRKVASKLGEMWTKAKVAIKLKYEDIADKDKERYKKEKAIFNKKQQPTQRASENNSSAPSEAANNVEPHCSSSSSSAVL